MATVYGIQNTLAKQTVPPSMIAPNTWNAKVRCSIDEYEASSLASGSTIYMQVLPKGAKVIGGWLLTDALGSGVQISVGIVGTTAKYLALTTVNTANLKTDLGLIDALGVELTAEETIILTTATAAATGTIKLVILYTME